MNDIYPLLLVFWPTILAAAFSASALSLLGALLVTRQAAVQVLPVSQSAALGVSLGLLFVQSFFSASHLEHTLLPLFIGLLCAALGFLMTTLFAKRSHSPVVVHLAFFAACWSLTQLLNGFFPALESHSSALFFGDIVTLTRAESYFFMALAAAGTAFLWTDWKRQAHRAFLHSILEEPFSFRHKADVFFYLTSLLLISLSVQFLGLLFTIGALFIPTCIYSFSRQTGAGIHLRNCAISAAFAAAAGFAVSLIDGRFLTTPLISILFGITPLAQLAAQRILYRCK